MTDKLSELGHDVGKEGITLNGGGLNSVFWLQFFNSNGSHELESGARSFAGIKLPSDHGERYCGVRYIQTQTHRYFPQIRQCNWARPYLASSLIFVRLCAVIGGKCSIRPQSAVNYELSGWICGNTLTIAVSLVLAYMWRLELTRLFT